MQELEYKAHVLMQNLKYKAHVLMQELEYKGIMYHIHSMDGIRLNSYQAIFNLYDCQKVKMF